MQQEYVKYEGIPSIGCNIAKTLELQKWILDSSSRPYDVKDNRLIARSAGTEVRKEDKSLVQKQLELQQMVLSNY